MNNLTQIIQTGKTIFRFQEIKELLGIPTDEGLKSFLRRAKAQKVLLNPVKGIWTLPHYDPLVLACVLKPWSYISGETVLFREGVFFQFYGNTISCMNSTSRRYSIGDKTYIYYTLKDSLLRNPLGIREHEGYRIATPERALCDYIYLNPRGVIDAPESINRIRLKQLFPLYPKQTVLRIQQLLDASSHKA